MTILSVDSTALVTVGKQMSIYGKLTDKYGKNLVYPQVKITLMEKQSQQTPYNTETTT